MTLRWQKYYVSGPCESEQCTQAVLFSSSSSIKGEKRVNRTGVGRRRYFWNQCYMSTENREKGVWFEILLKMFLKKPAITTMHCAKERGRSVLIRRLYSLCRWYENAEVQSVFCTAGKSLSDAKPANERRAPGFRQHGGKFTDVHLRTPPTNL